MLGSNFGCCRQKTISSLECGILMISQRVAPAIQQPQTNQHLPNLLLQFSGQNNFVPNHVDLMPIHFKHPGNSISNSRLWLAVAIPSSSQFGFAEGGGRDVHICESVSNDQGVLTFQIVVETTIVLLKKLTACQKMYSACILSKQNLPPTKYPRWNIVYFHRLHIEHLSI